MFACRDLQWRKLLFLYFLVIKTGVKIKKRREPTQKLLSTDLNLYSCFGQRLR